MLNKEAKLSIQQPQILRCSTVLLWINFPQHSSINREIFKDNIQ